MIGEGQDHDGEAWRTRLVRCGSLRRGRWACRASLDRIGSHWPSDVLEFFLSEIDERFLDPVTHLAIGVLGKTNTARISNAFKARGDVDAIAHQVAVALLDHIADMDADPELDAAFRWQAALRSTIPFCTSMAQRTASTTLRNSMMLPSPVRFTTRP